MLGCGESPWKGVRAELPSVSPVQSVLMLNRRAVLEMLSGPVQSAGLVQSERL